ncbi:MAG: hypothetical protein RJB13_865 [Pseudomonadota bacterium]
MFLVTNIRENMINAMSQKCYIPSAVTLKTEQTWVIDIRLIQRISSQLALVAKAALS